MQVDVVFLDFSKAFDTIDHDILSSKLSYLNLPNNLQTLLLNYLSKRSHLVSLGQYTSQIFFLQSGVPQGSSLGSPLFTIYINDINTNIKSYILIFTDDVKLFRVIQSPTDSFTLQSDLTTISNWSKTNLLPLNISKCHILSFTRSTNPFITPYIIDNILLERVFSTCDLGVVFDNRLSFNEQIFKVVSSASKALSILFKSSKYFSNPSTEKCYTTL